MRLFIACILCFFSSPLLGVTFGTPVRISPAGDICNNANAAIDSSGNGVAVWKNTNTGTIQAAVYTASTGTWSMPQDISVSSGSPLNPKVAVDAGGNGYAVWRRSDGMNARIEANVLQGGVWQGAAFISNALKNADNPQVSAGPSGTAVAVWQRNDNITSQLQAQASIFSSGSWGAAQTLSTDTTKNNVSPKVSMNSSGVAVAVWQYNQTPPATSFIIQAARYSGGMWTNTMDLTASMMIATIPDVAVDNANNAVAIWNLGLSPAKVLQGAVLSFPGLMWTGTTSISAADSIEGSVEVDSAGNAVATWEQIVMMPMPSIVIEGANLPFGGAWSTASLLSNPANIASDTSLGVSSTGQAVSTWVYDVNDLQAVVFDGSAWLPQIFTVATLALGPTSTDVNGSNQAIIVWEDGNFGEIFASTGSISPVPPIDPPPAASGSKQASDFGVVFEIGNFLSWVASPSTDVAGYRIYRGTTLIATLPASQLQYTDHNQTGKPTQYSITSLSSLGTESDPISFTVR